MFRLPLLLTPLLLSGCGLGSGAGIWLLTFVVDDETESVCDTTIRENFTDGYVPGGGSSPDSNWTYTETYDPPDALAFAQLETTVSGEAVLVYGGVAYPGVGTKGSWTFTWADEESQGATEEHVSGYRYAVTSANSTSVTILMDMDGGNRATGSMKSDGTGDMSYEESDELDFDHDDIDEVTDQYGMNGQIPSSSYLVYDNDDDDQVPQDNSFDEDDDNEGDDCESGMCELSVTSTCTLSVNFDAERTDFQEEAAYAHLVGAGQGSM